MKRVLMTGDTVGGVWTFALELAEALGPHDVEVVLAAMGGRPSKAQRAEAHRIRNLRLMESSFKLEWMEDPWEDVAKSCRWLLDLEQFVAPDVIHLNTYAHAALPWSAPVLLTGHSCVISWWSAVKGGNAPPQWSRYRSEVARGLKAAAMVTAPSHAMLAALREYGALRQGRVVYNGCAASRFHAGVKEDMILCAGRIWDEGKNVSALARIAPDLRWPVCVAGETNGSSLFGCKPLGKLSRSELANWYARASIYALPARYEPFGLSALEAALSGCTLVLGDIASLREIWQDAAVYVPPNDPQILSEVLCALIDDEPLRRALAEWACERARHFTAERMAREYLTAYEELSAGMRLQCAS